MVRKLAIATALLILSLGVSGWTADVAVASPQDVEISGTVVAVDPGSTFDDGFVVPTQVEIQITGGQLPVVGDVVRFRQEVPGVGAVEVDGDWIVSEVRPDAVVAIPEDGFIYPAPDEFDFPLDPSIGHSAVINSARARTTAQVQAEASLVGAAAEGDVGAVRAGLGDGIHPDARGGQFGMTALIAAALGGHDEIVSILLDAGADPAAGVRGQTALNAIASFETTTALNRVLAAGVDPNMSGTYEMTPLHAALIDEAPWLNVFLLVNAGADVNARLAPDTPDFVMQSYPEGASGAVTTRVSRGNATPLLLAAVAREDEAIIALLAAGADVEARNAEGLNARAVAETMECDDCIAALDAAAEAPAALAELLDDTFNDALTRDGSLEIIRLLLAAGIDPNSPRPYEGAALHQLAQDPADDLPLGEAVALLIAAGADIELAIEDATPLLVAVGSDEPEAARALLENGAAVNRQVPADAEYEPGFTALMLAAENGSEEMVEILLAAGADRNLRDAEGRTAADIAAGRDYLRLADRLRE